jgi:hypothetical protein
MGMLIRNSSMQACGMKKNGNAMAHIIGHPLSGGKRGF